MTKSEREKLIEEKNYVVGRERDNISHSATVKLKSFFFNEDNSANDEGMDATDSYALNDSERAILKVIYFLQ